MRYNQKKNTCVGMSVANAIEHQLGIQIPEDEIYDYFGKHFGSTDGVTMPRFLQELKIEPLHGVTVKSYKEVYNDRKQKRANIGAMSRIVNAMFVKKQAVVGSFKLRTPKLPLDKHGVLQPNKTRVRGYHAMYIKKLKSSNGFRWKRQFLVENSWRRK